MPKLRFVAVLVPVVAMVAACSGAANEDALFGPGPAPTAQDDDAGAPAVDGGGAPVPGLPDAATNDASQAEAGCTPTSARKCHLGNVHVVDSCGKVSALAQSCANGCDNGTCVTCAPHANAKCYVGDLYWYDSCGKREELKQDCTDGCSGSACNVCNAHASAKCFANDLYWYDSCGKREELKEDCPGSCSAGACAPKMWRCFTAAGACNCLFTADALTYPDLACGPAACCLSYESVSGPTCHCGAYDQAVCNQYVSTYSATKRASCPP